MSRTGGIPYFSPEAVAYREAHTILSMEVGHDKPDADVVWALAARILDGTENEISWHGSAEAL